MERRTIQVHMKRRTIPVSFGIVQQQLSVLQFAVVSEAQFECFLKLHVVEVLSVIPGTCT